MSLLHQLALTFIPGIGNITARNLLSYCGSEEDIFKSKKSTLLKIPGFGEKLVSSLFNSSCFELAAKELEFIERFKIDVYFYTSPQYPKRLKNCEDAPILLYSKGNADLNSQKIISIVGTRNATDYGKDLVRQFIAEIKRFDPLIVSGLAYGIDITAHKEALKNDLATIGVLGHGLDRIYPANHRFVAEKMIKYGGLLTEFPSQTKADRENFPQRNRIVAGISDATIVVEAGESGGALITAEIANGYSRDVFAFPGRSTDLYSIGCNDLIKSCKAQLINNSKDFEYFMSWSDQKLRKSKQHQLFFNFSSEEKVVFDIISAEKSIYIDDLMLKSKFSSGLMSKILLNLELNAIVRQNPGKVYTIF